MRAPILTLLGVVLLAGSAAAARRPLDLPIRVPGRPTPAPAYAGDVLEIRLSPGAARQAWPAYQRRPADGGVGVMAVDRAARELGGVRFEPLFRGERPPDPGSAATDFTAFYVAHLPPGLDLERALDRLEALPEVASVDPIAIMPLDAVPNDSLWTQSTWYYQASRRDIHAPEAWDITTGDTSIVVGVLDTGVLSYHPDIGGEVAGLPGQIYTNWVEAAGVPGVDDDGNGYVDDLHGWDFVNLTAGSGYTWDPGEDCCTEDNNPDDYVAHGTAVAGLIGALTDNVHGVAGVNWKVRIMPLRVGWAYQGSGLGSGEIRMDFVTAAVRYAARNGAHVINCSFANELSDGIEVALDEATAAGVTVVTSAGNTVSGVSQPNYMATRRDVISVASVGSTDVLSGFSNRGPQVDLAAPGQLIASTWLAPRTGAPTQGSYSTILSGTSFSAPLVAGGAALIQARQRQFGFRLLDPMSVQLRLFDTADDIRAQNPGLDGQYGNGRLNLARAVDEAWRSKAVTMGGRMVGAAAVFRNQFGGTRVAVATDNSRLLLLDGSTLDTVWTATLPFGPVNGPAVGTLPGQGIGIFVGLTSGRVAGYLDDGTALPGWPMVGTGAMRGGPVVWDLDGDGSREVVAGSDVGRVWAWHSNGTPVAGFPVDAAPGYRLFPVAVSHDVPARIAASADDGSVTLLDEGGNVLPGWPIGLSGTPSVPTLATVQGQEAVVIADDAQLHAFGFDGQERPGFPVALVATLPSRAEVVIGDVDRDGTNDLAVPGASPPTLDVRDSTGASLTVLGWPRVLPAPANGSPVLGPLTGTASPGAMLFTAAGLLGFSSAGDSLLGFPKPGGGGTFPTLFDLDGDGTTEVLAGSTLDRMLFGYDAGPASATLAASPWPTFRGDFQRTGCSRDPAPVPMADFVPPDAVSDLSVSAVGLTTLRLRWTAPGDDGDAGRAHAYDVRRSLSPIDLLNFAAATRIPSGAPGDPLGTDSLDVGGLSEGITYYFALKALDEAGNAGAISNLAQGGLNTVSPAAVTDLRVTAISDSSVTLAWTATGDDGTVGRPDLYVVRGATTLLTDANFNQAPYVRNVPATVDAGGTETLFIRFLDPATTYWFALKAYDTGANISGLSNVVRAQTRVGGPLASKTDLALAPGRNPSRVPAPLYWQAAPEAQSQTAEIRIHDLMGRRVRTLEVGPGVGGVAQWDGNDDDGHRVPAGLYLLRLESGARHTQSRLVLLP